MQGIVARFSGDFAAAESAFQRLVTESPGDFAAANQLALVLLEQDQPEKQRRAVQLAESIYRQYPRSVDARATLGWAYFREGRPDDAEAAFGAIVPPEQVGGDSAYYAATFHHQRGRSDVAQALLNGALAGRGAFTQRRAAIELLELLGDLKSKATTDRAAD
jgi:tetratricopeptide (TPR) repeat protein